MVKLLLSAVLAVALACSAPTAVPDTRVAPVSNVPLTELTGFYYGFTGGLYGNSSNLEPQIHVDSAFAAARRIEPRSLTGQPGSGRYVLQALGYSNATQEFCASVLMNTNPPCTAWSFMGKAKVDTAIRKGTFGIFNGAVTGQTNTAWDSPTDSMYDTVAVRLAAKNGSEQQVQIIWFKIANKQPTASLPNPNADLWALIQSTANAVRAMKVRYPNLQMVFLSPRIYGGYAKIYLNPEPYAYESAFAVQYVISAQIGQYQTGTINALTGDLGTTVAPWVGWGPYLWANGSQPRADGLKWVLGDFESDGTHPSTSGETKVANLLLQFFKTTPYTRCWFLKNQMC